MAQPRHVHLAAPPGAGHRPCPGAARDRQAAASPHSPHLTMPWTLAKAIAARVQAMVGGKVATGAVWAFAITFTGYSLSFVTQVVLARILGVEEYGTYVYILGIMGAATVFAKLELDTTAVRYVAEYRSQGNWARLAGFSRWAQRNAFLAAALVSVLALPWLLYHWKTGHASLVRTGLVATVVFPLLVAVQVRGGILQGFERVAESQVPNQLLRPLVIVLLVAILWLTLPKQLGAPAALVCNGIAVLATWVVLGRLLRRSGGGHPGIVPDVGERPVWFSTMRGLTGLALAQFVMSAQTDIILVGSIAGVAQAGIYGVASQLAQIVSFGVNAIMFAGMPSLSSLHSSGERERLAEVVQGLARLSLGIAVPLGLGLIVIGPWVLGLYGPAFRAGFPVLLVLTLQNCIVGAGFGTVQGVLLSMTGHQAIAVKVTGSCAVLYLLLAVPMTHFLGPLGTALSTTTAYLVRAIWLHRVIHREFGFRALPFGLPKAMPQT